MTLDSDKYHRSEQLAESETLDYACNTVQAILNNLGGDTQKLRIFVYGPLFQEMIDHLKAEQGTHFDAFLRNNSIDDIGMYIQIQEYVLENLEDILRILFAEATEYLA